ARLFRSDFSGAEFNGASLEIARLDKSWFVGTRFIATNMQEAKGNAINLKDAYFESTITRYAIFPSTNMEGCTGCPKGWD
ncbi:pentapeptide repeat-containing protein, partial [Arthrospira platensis SPKY1]|nr:pentapeptide repeat-containing protein [Arthrospira platensis SPKY1]